MPSHPPMDESAFETIADETLQRFMDVIDDALGDELDVDLEGGILTIEFESGAKYVINKHAPNRQIWMSSPVGGATHYDYDDGAGGWRSTRGDELLAEVLSAELAKATGQTVTL